MAGVSSNLLKNKIEKIMSLWEARSLEEVPSAVTAVSLVLRNSLPLYLEHLSEALATNRKMDKKSVISHDQEGIRIGKLHGEDRAGRTSYVLTEVIFEYHILREVIFQVLEADGPLPVVQRDIILDSIEQAVNDAAVKFSEVHSDTQKKFIDTLTHDLKNPISGAKMSAQLILKRAENAPEFIELSSKIVRAMNRLTIMIDDLLDAGRVRAGEQLALQFVECDLSEVVRETVEEMTFVHGDRFVFDAKETHAGKWGCDGLRRALENLMGNAVKYGSKDTPIRVELSKGESGVEISVHNLGTPIAADEIPRMFELYRRSKSVEGSGVSGWGLGLTLVKGVTDAHKGRVRVESDAGKGTSFILEIPFL